MNSSSPVPVLLDLRQFRDVPTDPAGYIALWREIEPLVCGLDPHRKATYDLNSGDRGRLGIRFVDPAAAPRRLDATTPFAIRGVIEPPQVRYACGTCGRAGHTRYGPFRCAECQGTGQPDRICDDHAVIVDLNFRRVSCPAHAPRCRCARAATFWCGGPSCRGAVAWCAQHRVTHPGDASRGYCTDCYARRFPACATRECHATGSMSCEYTDDAGRPCGARHCPRHGFRWQVYGPQRTGLALCPTHREHLHRLPREQLVRLVVAGTALRRRKGRGPLLPPLRAIRHMLINVRGDVVEVPVLAQTLTQIERRVAGTPMAALFDDRYRRSVAAAVSTASAERDQGRAHFAALQRFLTGRGYAALAAQMTYSDFTPRSNLLFVRVPESLRGQFFGRGGENVRAMSEHLGLSVKLEKS